MPSADPASRPGEADPDPSWRDRVRDPAVRHDRKVLEQLAAQAAGGRTRAAVVDVLGVMLSASGRRCRAAARRSRRLRFDRASGSTTKPARMLTEVKPWDAVGFFRAALALRPQTGSIYYNLGLALVSASDWEEAMESYRQAIAIDPDLAAVRTRLGDLLAEHAKQTPSGS